MLVQSALVRPSILVGRLRGRHEGHRLGTATLTPGGLVLSGHGGHAAMPSGSLLKPRDELLAVLALDDSAPRVRLHEHRSCWPVPQRGFSLPQAWRRTTGGDVLDAA